MSSKRVVPERREGRRGLHGSRVAWAVGAAASVLLLRAPVPARAQQAASQAQPAAAPIPVMEFDAVIAQAIAKNPTIARAAITIQRADALL